MKLFPYITVSHSGLWQMSDFEILRDWFSLCAHVIKMGGDETNDAMFSLTKFVFLRLSHMRRLVNEFNVEISS